MIFPSSHAQLRWLQRVDPMERYPAAAIRRAVEHGDRYELGTNAEIVVDDRHGVEIVLQEDRRVTTAVTVLSSYSEGRA